MTDAIADGLLKGTIAAGARAIRWLDDRDPRGAAVIRHIFPATGRAQIVGITGPPGAGKSMLTDMLVTELRRPLTGRGKLINCAPVNSGLCR